jgi:hypothetical protein
MPAPIYVSAHSCPLRVALVARRRVESSRVFCVVQIKYLYVVSFRELASRLSNKALIKYRPATLFSFRKNGFVSVLWY